MQFKQGRICQYNTKNMPNPYQFFQVFESEKKKIEEKNSISLKSDLC